MSRPAPNFTELEWRQLAQGCRIVAEKEREHAAAIGGTAGRGFEISAETFERLARRCLDMTRPAP